VNISVSGEMIIAVSWPGLDVFQVIADKKYHVENDKQDERDANIAAI